MGFWDRLLGRKPSSGQVAKDRLQLVLVHDRSELLGLSPEIMEQMRDELIMVLSKYVEINREEMDISLTQATRVAEPAVAPYRSGTSGFSGTPFVPFFWATTILG